MTKFFLIGCLLVMTQASYAQVAPSQNHMQRCRIKTISLAYAVGLLIWDIKKFDYVTNDVVECFQLAETYPGRTYACTDGISCGSSKAIFKTYKVTFSYTDAKGNRFKGKLKDQN